MSADTPQAGETTLTDSTTPTLTSVTWAHTSITVKPKTTVKVTVKLSDDCAGAGDVWLQLHNATTHLSASFEANYVSSTITATAIHDTWAVVVPLYNNDAGSISVTSVSVLSGFTSLVYDSTKVVDLLPHDDQVTPADYHDLTLPKAAKIAVKNNTTLSADASPEPGKVGHRLTVKASLKKLKSPSYVAYGAHYVTIQYKGPGSSTWHTLKKAKTSSSGVVSATYKPSKKGTYSFRAVYAGSTYVAAVTSATDSVKVS